MQDESRLTPAEMELEVALKGLTPAASQGLRDRVMFKAGYARGRLGNHLWQGVASCLGLMLAISICAQPGPVSRRVPQDKVAVDRRYPAPSMEPAPQQVRSDQSPAAQYLSVRKAVLEQGMDVLPAWRPVPYSVGRVSPSRDCMDEILASI